MNENGFRLLSRVSFGGHWRETELELARTGRLVTRVEPRRAAARRGVSRDAARPAPGRDALRQQGPFPCSRTRRRRGAAHPRCAPQLTLKKQKETDAGLSSDAECTICCSAGCGR